MTIVRALGTLLIASALSGCEYLPHIVIDNQHRSDAATAATIVSDAPTHGTAEIPDPAPRPPAQLVAIRPSHAPLAAPPTLSATLTAIKRANDRATRGSTPDGFVEATQFFDYVPGTVYQVITRVGSITSLSLQPGEKIKDYLGGDTARWDVTDSESGAGATLTKIIIIKPHRPDLKTNLAIMTDRRIYDIELVSTQSDAYNVRVIWSYPQDQLRARQHHADEAARLEDQTIATAIPLDHVNFNYAITTVAGSAPRWLPARAFDDGAKTYIQFPPDLGTIEAPPLFVIGADQKADIVTYRPRGNFYVVDRLFDVAELRLGTSSQTIVRIERKDRVAAQ